MEGMAKMHKEMDSLPKCMKTDNPKNIPASQTEMAKSMSGKCERNKIGQMMKGGM